LIQQKNEYQFILKIFSTYSFQNKFGTNTVEVKGGLVFIAIKISFKKNLKSPF
jgi:hypothetical protein